jgi:GDPmannose 4,6-dehydratase
MISLNEVCCGTKRRAMICGVGGQDGAYLARFLLSKGYEVFGTSRDSNNIQLGGLKYLGIDEDVSLISMAPSDFRSVLQTVSRVAPDEIYNLSGQSSVGLSFDQPVETIESIVSGVLNLLEAIRFMEKPIGFYNAGSSECFGDTGYQRATEATPFRPRSPYAVAKACAHNLVANYREAYRMRACTGILFNHESPLRSPRFVTQKIVRSACNIALKKETTLTLGNLDIHRDWGWAPEYVEVMWKMLQLNEVKDFVIATGRTVSLEYFVERTFECVGLDWRKYVRQDVSLLRPSDLHRGAADPSLAMTLLGWQAMWDVDRIIPAMCSAAQEEVFRK